MRTHSRSGGAWRALAFAAFAAAPAAAFAKDIDLAFPAELAGDQGRAKTIPLGVNDSNGLESLSLTVEYDASVLLATGVLGTPLSAPLDLTVDLGTPGRILIDLGNGGRIGQDSGTLLEFGFDVIGAPGTSSAIDLVSAVVNGGSDSARFQDGLLRVVGPTPSIVRFIDASGADAVAYVVGDSVVVEVADADRDRDSGRVETLSASVTAATNADTETVALTETGDSTGVFRGSIGTVAHSVSRPNGSLDVRGQDTLTVAYSDPADSGDAASDEAAVRNRPTTAVLTFVDEFGHDAARASAGAAVFLKLVDPDRNLDPGGRDAVTVALVTDATADSETVEMIESGFASGEFVTATGVATEFWAEKSADGRLQVLANDRVRATYTDPSSAGETAAASIAIDVPPSASLTRLVSSGGEDRTTFMLEAESVVVLVAEGDKNANPAVVEFLAAEVSVSGSGDVESVSLAETGAGTGAFRAVLPTARAATAVPGDGILQGLAGATVTAAYADANDPADRTSDSAAFLSEPTSAILRFTDAAGSPVTAASVGDGLFVEVADADQDADPEAIEEITARVDVGDTGDYEPVTLVETGAATGVFRSAELASVLSSPPVPGNASLEVSGTSSAEASYVDANASDDAATAGLDFTVEPTAAVLRFVDAATGGTTPIVYVGTGPAVLELADGDQNADAAAAESVTALVSVAHSGDSETVTLVETGPSTGVFRASIATLREKTGAPADGVLAGSAGSAVAAEYTDARDASDAASAAATLALRPTPSSIEATDAATFGVTSLVAGQSLFLAVRDADRDLDTDVADTVTVSVAAPSGDSETLTLAETGASSGLFRTLAGLPTAAAAAAPENGVLEIAPGESVVATYSDPLNAGDVSAVSLRVDAVGRKSILRLTDAYGRDADALLIGRDAIFATLSDPSRDLDPSARDTVAMQLLNPRTGDLEDVTLVETGPATGNFINAPGVGLGFGSAVSPDGTVAAVSGDVLAAGYTDAGDPSDVSTDSASITVAAGTAAARFVDAAGAPRDRFEIGAELVFASVTDGDQNSNPDLVESLRVTVTVTGTNDLEAVDLVETGANTGVFRNAAGLASVATSVGTQGNGVLEGRRGYFLEVAYADPDDPSDVASGNAVFVVGSSPSAVRIVDDAGRDVTVRTLVSDRVFVLVTESDKNGDRTVVEEITAELSIPARGDREVVRLVETGPDTGVFRSAGTATDFRVPSIAGNGILEGTDGDPLVARYVDSDDASDSSTDSILLRVRATASLVRATNSSGSDVDRFRIGRDRLYVTVVDPDENRNPATPQTIRALVLNPLTGDREGVTLVETGPNSGTFRNAGGLPLGSAGAPTADDGRLDGRHLNDVLLDYTDPDAETGDGATTDAELVMLTPSTTQFVTSGNYPTGRYQIGVDRVYVRVEDGNRNLDSASRDVVEVVVTVDETGDYETLILTETGPDTGRFFGPTSGLRLSKNRSVVPDNGELIIGAGDEMVARYEDAMDSTDMSEDTAEGGDPADPDSTVPTLGEWGLILLAAGLGISLVTRARRQAAIG